eukprot:372951_1
MKSLPKFYKLCDKLLSNSEVNIDIIIIYIEEAHASDGSYSLKGNFDINNHNNIKERIDACNKLLKIWANNNKGISELIKQKKINIIMDNMKNSLMSKCAAWPERLYVVNKQKIIFQGGMGPQWYSVDEVSNFLNKYTQ